MWQQGDNMISPKARALGRALREAREATGLSLRAFARDIGRDPGVLSRWETGDRTPQVDQVAQILTKLGVTGAHYDEVIELTRGTDERRWLAISLPEQRQQFAALLDLEVNATDITDVAPLLVPGLLQTNDYIRSIMSAGDVPTGEIATRVAVRIGRKDVLTRSTPVRMAALVGEAALRQRIGSREVMAGQLRYLREAMARPNVDVRVIPFDSGWHPALEGPCYVIHSESGPVVHLEVRGSVLFLHEERDVNAYLQAVGTVFAVTMSPEESAELINEYAERWERTE